MLSRPRPIALLHGTDQGSERSSDRERYAVPAFFARVLSHTESSLNVARAKKKKKNSNEYSATHHGPRTPIRDPSPAPHHFLRARCQLDQPPLPIYKPALGFQ